MLSCMLSKLAGRLSPCISYVLTSMLLISGFRMAAVGFDRLTEWVNRSKLWSTQMVKWSRSVYSCKMSTRAQLKIITQCSRSNIREDEDGFVVLLECGGRRYSQSFSHLFHSNHFSQNKQTWKITGSKQSTKWNLVNGILKKKGTGSRP